jgi:apoptosis-inducing factor 2
MVQPRYADRAIISIADAHPKVRHIQGRLAEWIDTGGLVDAVDGARRKVTGDVSVLATGSRFAGEFVRSSSGSMETRKAVFRRHEASLSTARRILIVGGGPIGVEMAAEIVEAWPGRSVTIVESGARILGGAAISASAYAAKFPQYRGVTLLTGERIESPSPADCVSAEPSEARTASGKHIGYDVILWCIGGRPNTEYLRAHFSDRLDADGRVRVTPQLLMEGEDRVFALGDTNLRENKMALHVKG